MPSVINATRGQPVQLRCTGKGYPLPLTVQWSKNGISIPFDKRHSVSDKNILTISKVQEGDAGPYKCQVVNGANKKDEHSVEVAVYGKCGIQILCLQHRL